MRQLHPNQIMAALQTLGVLQRFEQVVSAAKQTADLHAVRALLKAFKVEAEGKYKSLSMECHPDRGGDEEQMKEINAAWDIVKTLEVRPRRPPPQQVIFRMHVSWNNGTASTTTADSSCYTMGPDGWYRTA
jgi:hypothetical protein